MAFIDIENGNIEIHHQIPLQIPTGNVGDFYTLSVTNKIKDIKIGLEIKLSEKALRRLMAECVNAIASKKKIDKYFGEADIPDERNIVIGDKLLDAAIAQIREQIKKEGKTFDPA